MCIERVSESGRKPGEERGRGRAQCERAHRKRRGKSESALRKRDGERERERRRGSNSAGGCCSSTITRAAQAEQQVTLC